MRVQDAYLDQALDHIDHRGDTDIFPRPFEIDAIRGSWAEVKRHIMGVDAHMWVPGVLRQTLIPKGKFGFRIATQLDPLDTLFITAFVLQIATQLEDARIPNTDQIVHSHRYKPGSRGQIFDPQFSYESFRRRSLELAGAREDSFVVMTDIGDFYSRIYHHPLENAVTAATDEETGKVIKKFFSQINDLKSYGIPVGPSVCRLLADVDISDVDYALLSEGYTFCRYSDDYRLFAATEREAYEALTYLAGTLYRNHGLTLQASKTRVLSSIEYNSLFSASDEAKARGTLDRMIGMSLLFMSQSPYEFFDLDDMDEDQKRALATANLWELFVRAVSEDDIDYRVVRFALSWLRLAPDPTKIDIIFDNLDSLYPVFHSVMEYLLAMPLDATEQRALADRLLTVLRDDKIGVLDYHRELILRPFAEREEWDHKGEMFAIYNRESNTATRRAVILSLARQHEATWFHTRKGGCVDMPEWEKRAFLFGASTLTKDEANVFFRSLSSRLSVLDRAVVEFAKSTM